MRTPRIYLDTPLAPGQTLSVPPQSVKYLAQVLRLRTGDRAVLFNGDGYDYPVTLLRCDKNGVVVCTEAPGEQESAAAFRIHLAIGISRGDRMDFVLQKAVELGVMSIAPLMTARGTVRLDAKRLLSRERHWRGVIVSACEQSGRCRLPIVAPPMPLADWLVDPAVPAVVLDHRSPVSLPDIKVASDEISILVGPEGGLTDLERSAARQAGLLSARLGPRIMRTETAPIAAIAVAQALWGDFR